MSASTPDWQKELTRLWRPPVVVLGVGRRGHGDDAAGPLLIDQLPTAPDIVGIDCGTAPENFLGVVARHRPGLVLLVDATHTGALPGTVQVLSPDQLTHTDLGTHGLTPALFLQVLQEQVGAPCFVLAIEPERVGLDLPPSACLLTAIRAIVEFLGSRTPQADTS